MTSKRVLLTGRHGQLGTECGLLIPPSVEFLALDRPEFDLADLHGIRQAVLDFKPDVLLHTAAWTAVDKAESCEEEALLINAKATEVLAEAVNDLGGRMAYVSTDYVFSGEGSQPWRETDAVSPLNAYGRTKLAGEQALHAHLPQRGHVVRTSWLYGRRGANFVRTMLRLMMEGRDLQVVDDQKGSPTWAGGLGQALWALSESEDAPAILHFTDGGITSWFEFAIAIRELGLENQLSLEASAVRPCSSSAYPTPAKRPSWSPMHFSDAWKGLGIQQVPWRKQLALALPILLQEDHG